MYPLIIQSKYLMIYSWGLMVALGYLVALLISLYLDKIDVEPMRVDHVLGVYIVAAFSAIIGARAFFVIQFFKEYLKNPIEILMIQRGGFVFLGGFIAAIFGIYMYCRMNKLNMFKALDVMSPAVMLGYAIGRIGCFLNGCCYGIETNVFWGVTFPGESVFRHPTQLYSAFAGFLIFFLLLIVFQRRKYFGQAFFSAVLFYSVYRFLVEFVRYSPIRSAGLTPSQYILLLLFLFSIGFIWKKKNTIL